MSTAFEHTVAPISTPSPRMSSHALAHRPSPEPARNTSFPPPPGAGGRGASRERRFGLPSLGRRRDSDRANASPDQNHPAPLARRSMGASSLPKSEVGRVGEPTREPIFAEPQPLPPSARRAVSAGAIDTPTSARSRSTSQTRWEPGMPLPPPPPGPPPSGSRSQSVQSVDRNVVPILSPPTRRPPPSGVTSLGPVPPTPAHWIDSDHDPNQTAGNQSPGLNIDTLTASTSSNVPEALGSANSTGSLSRARAVRHDKTILQRRAESRTRHTSHGSIDAITRPSRISDIVVPGSSDRTGPNQKSSARSMGLSSMDSPHTGDSLRNIDSRNSTPRAPGSAQLPYADGETSPYSPRVHKYPVASGSHSSAPKSLPTPPPQARSTSGSGHKEMPRSLPSNLKPTISSQTSDQFAAGSVERFQAFAAQESTAVSDADRVRLFADFIVSESRIRRERYATAIGAMGSEIFDLTRDLFRPMTTSRRESAASQEPWTPGSSDMTQSQIGSVGGNSVSGSLSNSAPASANLPASPGGAPPANSNWGANNYMPSLSPILSMSVSENYENGSSRGRPPSRWWETDSQGEPGRLERSKRESKYMGVSKDQWIDEGQDVYGPGEQSSSSAYPPEKTGWHDQGEQSWTPQSLQASSNSRESPHSPSPHDSGYLDVSRLVTLPPPYPRHHPAVNNNHPELASIRTAVRGLSELSEMDQTKKKFAAETEKRRAVFESGVTERRQTLRENLQSQIGSGSMGYADAAAIEADAVEQEKDKKKELEKSEYEHFQNGVILPLHDLLTKRISRATDLFDDLARRLFDNGQNDADMPQEEGDDRPELLEKLTLLKWVFETRESLHRDIYDLLSNRNDRYRDVVLTPYRLAGNAEKLQSAEAFFANDTATREYTYANEVLNRAREFRSVMDEAVQRGVALQLSAFWDIAPPLDELLGNIPSNLNGFNIQIPVTEFEESPAYHDHPLQYLFSLLLHAEKSTYQFIESHTNLLCLLHEVKEAVVNAKARVLEVQLQDSNGATVTAEQRASRAQRIRDEEGRRLTEDLKEKVRVVQDQWDNALGEGMKSVKERTRGWLLETGGWDETLEDGEIGHVGLA